MSGNTMFPNATRTIERRELFRGQSSHLTFFVRHAGLAFIDLLGVAVGLYGLVNGWGWWAALGPAVILASGIVHGRLVIRVLVTRFRIDTLRIEVERGLVMRRIDNLELWRIKDLQFRQSVLQRMLGIGDLVIVSTDATSGASLEICGIKGARVLYDQLRDAVDDARQARGVVSVESTTTRGL